MVGVYLSVYAFRAPKLVAPVCEWNGRQIENDWLICSPCNSASLQVQNIKENKEYYVPMGRLLDPAYSGKGPCSPPWLLSLLESLSHSVFFAWADARVWDECTYSAICDQCWEACIDSRPWTSVLPMSPVSIIKSIE